MQIYQQQFLPNIALVLLLSQIQFCQGSHWAVLVAGSKGYYNYRHQADVCHAYHVMRSHGLAADHIIVMMYDDIAQSRHNPHPGQLFNQPDFFGPGTDVYANCSIDYRREQVNPANFLNILLGNKTEQLPKVLQSTAEDRVFVNFVDHGGVGLIGFPTSSLHALELVHTIEQMHQLHLYKELVLYVEACESGSMFQTLLPAHLNVFVTTAANARESSWGTYCPPHDFVQEKPIGTCLGDLYSVNWMQDSDRSDLTKETLQEQYEKVKLKTSKSHVMEFGSEDIGQEMVSEFQAESIGTANLEATATVAASSNVDSRDVKLISDFYMYFRAEGSDRTELAQELIREIQHREAADLQFQKIQTLLFGDHLQPMTADYEFTQFNCHLVVNQAVENYCGVYTDYSLKYEKNMVYACEELHDTRTIVAAIQQVCKAPRIYDTKSVSLS